MNDMYVKKTFTCENVVKSVRIQELAGEIVVRKGNVDHAEVIYSDRADDSEYDIVESGGELSIIRKKRIHLFNVDFFRFSMTVTLPDDLEGELEISNKSGSIQVSSLSGKKAAINNMTGNIMIGNVISEGDLTVDNTSGSVTLVNVAAGGDIDVKNTTGKIRVENIKSGRNISLINVTGSVTGTIEGKESDYSISTKTVTGSSSLENSDSGIRKLKVRTTTGSIKLSFI